MRKNCVLKPKQPEESAFDCAGHLGSSGCLDIFFNIACNKVLG